MKNRNLFAHSSGGWKSNIKVPIGLCSGECSFLPRWRLTWQKRWKRQALHPTWRRWRGKDPADSLDPSWLNHLQKPSLFFITLGLRFHCMSFGEHIHWFHSNYWTVYLEITKIINFVLCFLAQFKKKDSVLPETVTFENHCEIIWRP
jgi:hypothetical protein